MAKKRKNLVVLALTIAHAMVSFSTVGPKFTKLFRAVTHKRSVVETIKEMAVHAAFYGTAFGGFIGLTHASYGYLLVALFWFIGLSILAIALAERAELLEVRERDIEREESVKFLEGLRKASVTPGTTSATKEKG